MTQENVPVQLSPLPQTRSEAVTAAVHYYRAELARMAGWRDRIDRTTNWAITVVAALLSVSLSTASAHHGVLLFAMLLVYLLLMIEARRYRFFDVYRFRVRQFERHYFAQLFSPMPDFSANWLQMMGQNLREPKFFISYGEALSRRLRRNYIWMFLILLLAWVLKISTPKLQHEGTSLTIAESLQEVVANANLGPVPGWLVLAAVAAFFLWLAFASLRALDDGGESSFGEVHV
ncbi:DUF2270 domain-containing protein [Mesorhizobium sp. SP-1A]|uniref:DUF2270 domain-containing protein n=1 Tax=Mesorhizobium sp. SP-1A TaxID=3077840 RepID=UPI0028F6FACD|nr:DUF2270 domain-containing protein [Mesorhizobium sp. SP-1A]